MKTVTHEYVTADMDLLEENGLDRPVQNFPKHLSPHTLAVMSASVCLM